MIVWMITVIAQLFCLYKVYNSCEVDEIYHYNQMCCAFAILGICAAHVSNGELL